MGVEASACPVSEPSQNRRAQARRRGAEGESEQALGGGLKTIVERPEGERQQSVWRIRRVNGRDKASRGPRRRVAKRSFLFDSRRRR